ncbi:DNA-binding protein, partial [Phocaeicola dorei]
MVNYSIVMRSNPMDVDAAKKAYASAQYAEVMDINRFAEHIASHGCVYKRA